MDTAFDELEWECTSKEQDSLVKQLFGKLSDKVTSKASTRVPQSEITLNVRKRKKTPGKREKVKEDNEDDDVKTAKKKRKEKPSSHPELMQDRQSCNDKNESVTCVVRSELQLLVDSINEKKKLKRKKKLKKIHKNGSFTTDTASEKQKNQQKRRRAKGKFDAVGEMCNQPTEGKERDDIEVTEAVNKDEQAVSIESRIISNTTLEGSQSIDDGDVGSKPRKAKRKKLKEERSEVAGQSKQKRKKTANKEEQDSSQEHVIKNGGIERNDVSTTKDSKSLETLHEKMTKQLESSRFRWINEQLYTTTGEEALALFAKDPNLFDTYHRGFTNQVKQWPVNPVDKIIKWLRKRGPSEIVADFGCGKAVIAQSVQNTVYSFDLVAKNKHVTACNMAKVPLESSSVDVVVFCLALMGTNLIDFIREAHRVLKLSGFLKVAEVASRIEDTAKFILSLSRLGFELRHKDTSNKMFVMFDFIKAKESFKTVSLIKLAGLKLKPCIYKKR
ncbi:Ribosomal RNA-processing protein 8 [Acropora cervicornis]|uniref:Ribosomal RNA-processing protein 8 n=1 Tax=Acropora cervicornis TaxID=6130 RepID=A0AAD9V7H5_ACRCE|nr:Ribosomal RNA-processing protein 8 [Acropora cervicornis]